MRLTKADIRFLCWLSHCGHTAKIGKVSPTVEKLDRYEFIWRRDLEIGMTGLGWHALIHKGIFPQDCNGRTVLELIDTSQTQK